MNEIVSIKSLRNVIGALLNTYDNVSYWMIDPTGLIVTLTSGEKIKITIEDIARD